MNDPTNWRPDPFGAHELRFFSADGKPTLLVMDSGRTSYDKPPENQYEPPSTGGQHNADSPAMEATTEDHRMGSAQEVSQPDVPIPAVERVVDVSAGASQAAELRPHVEDPANQVAEPNPASGSNVVSGSQPNRRLEPAPSDAELHAHEVMSRPLKVAYVVVLGVLALSILGFAYVHLVHPGHGHPKDTAPPTTTVPRRGTTPVALPTTLSPNPEAAATALVSSWSTNNRPAALTVATPAAVATLFSTPYSSGMAINRGCSTTFSPIVCTFGPPGGASPTDPIHQIMVTQVEGGWYVSTVRVEN